MDLFSEAARRDPYPAYAGLRARSPVLDVGPLGLWMFFDHESVKRALTDQESFASAAAPAGCQPAEWMIFTDPPRHTKLRALVNRAFTARTVAALEPRIRELSRTLLAPHLAKGTMELMTDYAVPLPLMVIAEMLGADPADWPSFHRWSEAALGLAHTITGGAAAAPAEDAFRAASTEMTAYLDRLVAERRARPRDDLLTRLVEAEIDGDRLSQRDLLAFFQLLLVAGHETTTNLIGNALISFLSNPHELEKLRSDRALVPSAIEEALRHRSPVQAIFRKTKVDVQLHGQTVPAGKLVLAMVGAANRDPARFSEPDRFDIARDPNPHVAFGHGIHFCVGAPLARLEGRVAFEDLFFGLSDLAHDGDWSPRGTFHVLGPSRLPLRFVAR